MNSGSQTFCHRALGRRAFNWLLRVLLIWSTLGLSARAEAAEPVSVRAIVETKMYSGEAQFLQIEVIGSKSVEPPDVSKISDFVVNYRGPQDSSSTMTTIVNGRMSTEVSIRYALLYEITPRHVGRCVVPALQVRVEGKVYTTDPIDIQVIEPTQMADATLELKLEPRQAYVGQPVRMTLAWTFAGNVRGAACSMPAVEGIELLESVDPRPPGSNQNDKNFATVNIDGEPAVGALGRAVVNGKPGTTVTIERLYIARQPGNTTFGPARVDFNAVVGERPRSWMDSPWDDRSIKERRVAKSNTLTLEVQPLPEAGKPANFSGLVGEYHIAASVEKSQYSVGEPIPLKVIVSGPAPLSLVPPLDLRRAGEFGSDWRLPQDPALGAVTPAGVVFESSIRARSDRLSAVPSIGLSFFNTRTGKYDTSRTSPLPISLTPSINVSLPGEDDAQSGAPTAVELPGGLTPIHREQPSRAMAFADVPASLRDVGVLLTFGVPFGLFVLAMIWSFWRRVQVRLPRSRGRRESLRHTTKSLDSLRGADKGAGPNDANERRVEAVAHAIARCLCQWFDLPEASTTSAQLAAAVRQSAPGQSERFKHVVETFDRVRYLDRRAQDQEVDQLITTSRTLLHDIDQELKDRERAPSASPAWPDRARTVVTLLALSLVLGMPSRAKGDAAGSPDAWQLLLTRYDNALEQLPREPVKAKAKLAPIVEDFQRFGSDLRFTRESRAKAWFNAGNCAMLLDEGVTATIAYRRAQTLSPLLTGVSENLALARQKTGVAGTGSIASGPERGGMGAAIELIRAGALAVPRVVWFASAAVFMGLLWLLLAANTIRGKARQLAPGGIVVGVALLGIVTTSGLILNLWAGDARVAIVIASDVTPRSAPDDLLSEPVNIVFKPGIELEIIDRQVASNGIRWTLVRPEDGPTDPIQGWVRESQLALVTP